MADQAARIKQIVATRRATLPAIDDPIRDWGRVRSALAELADALDVLPEDVRARPQVEATRTRIRSRELDHEITRAEVALQKARNRFARETVNIGVSGQARVGKSTLLQSISGLGSEQIPSGSGLPVTAVRSKIFHTAGPETAVLQMHTFQTFVEDVLQPYHDALSIGPAPDSLGAFEAYDYDRVRADGKNHRAVTELQRLRDMHASLPTYRDLLTGGQRTEPLANLRQYVAYPTESQLSEGVPPRKYLAVRDVTIHTGFPTAPVEGMGIIDLPGLGEVAVGADTHHVAGLENDVDVVILMKRPLEGAAYWKLEDSGAVAVLDRARGAVARRDFVFLLVNLGQGASETLVSAVRTSILREANEAVPDKHFRVLEADASDARAVSESVLNPLLAHLADNLPAMDRAVLAEAQQLSIDCAGSLSEALVNLVSALRGSGSVAPSVRGDIDRRAEELRRDIAVALTRLVAVLRTESRQADTEDEAFVSVVNEAAEACYAWVDSGFGSGDQETWVRGAYRAMEVSGASGAVMADGFNSARVRIASEFGRLDSYFNNVRVPALLAQIAELLSSHLGTLVPRFHDDGAPNAGRKWLGSLKAELAKSTEPAESVTSSLDQLLELRVEFRSLIYPRIRDRLDPLQPQLPDPETGELVPQIVVEVSEEGASELAAHLARRTRQAAYNTMAAILEDAQEPARVLYAVTELFEDALIRSMDSEEEFRAIGHTFRDDIWPGVYTGMEAASKRMERARSLGADAVTLVSQLQNN